MIDFWVSIGSTYSYLSVMRLHAVAGESGVAFRWRPFSVRAIMIEQKNIPFVGKPVKLAYMWRDIERRARARGLEPRLPAPWWEAFSFPPFLLRRCGR
jgi:2-hydroxychromene-2-carboxylate isomerase